MKKVGAFVVFIVIAVALFEGHRWLHDAAGDAALRAVLPEQMAYIGDISNRAQGFIEGGPSPCEGPQPDLPEITDDAWVTVGIYVMVLESGTTFLFAVILASFLTWVWTSKEEQLSSST